MSYPPRKPMASLQTAARFALLLLASLTLGSALAQNISDVPVAVKNNVAPNFMFMIDNSGSMSNIVPTSPYKEATTYFTCPGGRTIPSGSAININISGGVPRFDFSGTTYRHLTVPQPGSGTTNTNERCFDNTGLYSAKLLGDNSGTPSGYLPADYTGNFLNWYFGVFDGPATGWIDRKVITAAGAVNNRIEIARTSTTSVVNGLPLPPSVGASAPLRVGLSTYNSGNGGALRVAMNDLTSTSRGTLTTSIAGLTPSGNTPLASTLADIGRYLSTGYNGNITAGAVSGVNIDAFLQQSGTDAPTARNSCLSGSPVACNSTTATAAQKPIQQWCQRSYAFLVTDGRPQADRSFNNNTYLRDYDGDCQGVLASNCVGGSAGTIANWDRKTARTYESQGSDYFDDVAKALFDVDLRPDLTAPAGRTKRNNLLTYTIGFADLQVQNDPLLINTAANGGGLFLSAQDGPTLTQAFKTVISDALAKDAASAAVAVANAQITVDNTGYASSYNSGSWYGDLEAFSLDTTTGLPLGAAQWSARDRLDATTPAGRKIASFDGSVGRPFTATNFAGTPSTLTAGVINYLRGDRTGEGSTYRTRQHLLGDIINAEASIVNYPGDIPIIYQPANDGMLHVFDGRINGSVATRGQELWAYVPRLVHTNLSLLSAPGYSHKYFVDGSPATAAITGAGAMTRILAGGLGKGGAGYYALDITSYLAADENAAASKVKWEFKPANMGYSFGTPVIVNTAAGWRVVVTSGYDNGTALGGDGRGYVWVLNPSDGSIVQRMDTGVGSTADPSGLTHLGKLANTTTDAVVRYIYGGDLKGNVWRFDLDTFSVTKIATLTDGAGNYQPITSAPTVGPVFGSSTKFYVHVGTGRYLSDDDVPGTATVNSWATQTQTMYGIADDTTTSASLPNVRGTNGATCPSGGGNGDFVCQSTTLVSGPPISYRASANAVDLAIKRGWYIDIPVANGRVNANSALTTTGTLAFSVNVPTNATCDPGGSSYFFSLNASTGGAVAKVAGGNTYYDAGVFLAYALASRPVIVQTAAGKRALIRLSDRSIANPLVPESVGMNAAWKRIYWRSLK